MIERLAVAEGDAASIAAHVRGYVPAAASVADRVAGIVESVREGGDHALLEHERRFGAARGGTGDAPPGEVPPLRVPDEELAAALEALDPAVRAGLELAAANVRTVAEAGLCEDRELELPQGQRIRLRELPVARAAVYAPGGRRPYPSSVIMGAVTARAAGVPEVVVAAPAHPVILAACALCGADEVYRMGGAQAIAALAHGTESIRPVDVIVGPGNLYVQEAKRQVSGRVGIDGFAGPSDLLVLATAGADPRPIALDLLAQAEHGEDSLVVAVSDDAALLDAVGRDIQALYRDRSTVAAGPRCSSTRTGSTQRWRSRSRSRPSTCSSSGTRPRRSLRASAAPAACSWARRAARRSATTSPAPTTRCRPTARPASPPAWE